MTDHKTVREALESAYPMFTRRAPEVFCAETGQRIMAIREDCLKQALSALDRIEAALQTKPDPIFQCDDTPINKAYEG